MSQEGRLDYFYIKDLVHKYKLKPFSDNDSHKRFIAGMINSIKVMLFQIKHRDPISNWTQLCIDRGRWIEYACMEICINTYSS